MKSAIEHVAVNVTPVASSPRIGIDLTMHTPRAGEAPCVTPLWTTAGWSLQFVRLAAQQSIALDQSVGAVYPKVICGSLADPLIRPFAEPFTVRGTQVDDQQLTAGVEGAMLALIVRGAEAPDALTNMTQAEFAGPLSEQLQWQTFEARFTAFMDAFDGLDAYMAAGFHLLDDDGTEIVYLNPWTAGKGCDLTTHNHGNEPSPTAPAFAEVHWVVYNGTTKGGMFLTDAPADSEKKRFPVQSGEEHGAFFSLDGNRPKKRDNGAVDYPWHGWEAGDDGVPGQSYDYVLAFEINPDYVQLA